MLCLLKIETFFGGSENSMVLDEAILNQAKEINETSSTVQEKNMILNLASFFQQRLNYVTTLGTRISI